MQYVALGSVAGHLEAQAPRSQALRFQFEGVERGDETLELSDMRGRVSFARNRVEDSQGSLEGQRSAQREIDPEWR